MSAFDKPQAALDTSALAKPSDITAAVAPLAKAADAVQARTDILAAIVPLAKATDVAQACTDILAAMAGSGATQGEVRRFVQGSVPTGWQSLSDDPAYPSKGVLLKVQSGAAHGACAYVATGTGAGYWTYSGVTMQRIDLATAAGVGPAYPCGTGRNYLSVPFLVAIGKYLYIGGGTTTSSSALADLMRFDTETGAVLTLAALPRAIQSADAVVLNDGRILFWAHVATGLSQTPASTAFWFYNPATNLTAVEVLTALPLLNNNELGRNLVKMPSGAVLVMEGYDVTPATATAHTTRYSCLLTIFGNSIVAGPAENSGYSTGGTAPAMLASQTGMHLWQTGQVQRSYIEGVGWGAAAVTFAHIQAYANSNGNTVANSATLPGNTGWLFVINNNGTRWVYVLLTGANAPGAPILYAKKL